MGTSKMFRFSLHHIHHSKHKPLQINNVNVVYCHFR